MSNRTQRVYESPLAPDLAREILSTPIDPGEDLGNPRTIGDLVRGWSGLIDKANAQLRDSLVAGIVAKSIAQELKKRGDASIAVRHDGVVVLRVSYEEEGERRPPAPEKVRQDSPSVLKVNQSDIPLLAALREEAASLDLDISHFGRQRKAIHEYIQARKKVGSDQQAG